MERRAPLLAPGLPLPRLAVEDCAGLPVSLEPRLAIVVFYRGHWCEHCRRQLIALAERSSAFRGLGVHLVALANDDRSGCHAMSALARNVCVYRDPDAEIAERLGVLDDVELPQRRVPHPTTLLLDAAGIVRYRYVGREPADRPPIDLLLLAAERLALERA